MPSVTHVAQDAIAEEQGVFRQAEIAITPPAEPIRPPAQAEPIAGHHDAAEEEEAPVGALVFLLGFIVLLIAGWLAVYLHLWVRG